MEKNITLSVGNPLAATSVNTAAGLVNTVMNLVANVLSLLNVPVDILGEYYSRVLGRRLDRRQTRLLINAQLAFFAVAFTETGLLLHIVFALWFLHAVLACRRAL